jgi:hypothetical protein
MNDQDTNFNASDDVEGHRPMFSDRNVKEDVQPVDHEDDTEGHRTVVYSDRTLKEDVQPVDHEDDTEGHRTGRL